MGFASRQCSSAPGVVPGSVFRSAPGSLASISVLHAQAVEMSEGKLLKAFAMGRGRMAFGASPAATNAPAANMSNMRMTEHKIQTTFARLISMTSSLSAGPATQHGFRLLHSRERAGKNSLQGISGRHRLRDIDFMAGLTSMQAFELFFLALFAVFFFLALPIGHFFLGHLIILAGRKHGAAAAIASANAFPFLVPETVRHGANGFGDCACFEQQFAYLLKEVVQVVGLERVGKPFLLKDRLDFRHRMRGYQEQDAKPSRKSRGSWDFIASFDRFAPIGGFGQLGGREGFCLSEFL